MKIDQEARMTIRHLCSKGVSNREVARLLGVSEGAVRYHRSRQEQGAVDGRSKQPQLAEAWSEAIEHYLSSIDRDAPLNLAALHEWLMAEHDYPGSLRSIQRYFRKHYPKPRKRARRRVETPPGAQAQVDWDEYPRLWVGGRQVRGYRFHLKLSHSRRSVTVWSARKDQLSWLTVHNEAFRRIEGIPATIRVDNVKTAVARGAGPWGEFAPSYRSYAKALRFHIDACLPRSPEHKGKVERSILDYQRSSDVRRRHWDSWEHLQEHADTMDHELSRRRLCPATGTSVLEAWRRERFYLSPVPLLPDPFDLVATRRVQLDCTVGFEGRRYSVPFEFVERMVEVRGCARTVQVLHDGLVVAEHPRHTSERILIDPAHYEGEATAQIQPPTPLGRMGKRLEEIWQTSPQQRPLDLYAALAEVAR
ncbi:MAG: IS21 family transposase [Desulfacinum sp.]|nr:IS21 family transposase [Desulfacinum sp.]